MHALWLVLTTLAAAGRAAPAGPAWEKVYDGGEHHAVALVRATGREDWVAAGGRWGLATARHGTVQVEDTHGHGVLGFFADTPGSVYALGEGELVWHYEHDAWTQEHIAPMPSRGRRPFAAHMLYVGYLDDARPTTRLVAVGLELALVKQADGRWSQPLQAERSRLGERGLLGPELPAPAGCARAAWRWLGRHRGAFTCHDGRLFTWDDGVVSDRGKLPRPCADVLGSLIDDRGTLFASCNFATLWKGDGGGWRRIVAPKEPGLTEIGSISFAEGCLFVAGKRALWRTCDP